MRRHLGAWRPTTRQAYLAAENLIHIEDATFYRDHPSSYASTTSTTNAPLFPKLNFKLEATSSQYVGQPVRESPHWAVIGTSTTAFLKVLRGEYITVPSRARTFPHLSSDEIAQRDPRLRIPSTAIQYVGFNNGSQNAMGGGTRGAYLSARYESRVETTDWTVKQFLEGDTELNPSEDLNERIKDKDLLQRVVRDLRMEKLLDMPVSRLSNGQTRRSRIAKALLSKPELLLLDEPFMGLDPPTLTSLTPILRGIAYRSAPLLLFGLRPQDPIPTWVTHLAVLGHNNTLMLSGTKSKVLHNLWVWSYFAQSRDYQQRFARRNNELTSLYGEPLTDTPDMLSEEGMFPITSVEQLYKHHDPKALEEEQAICEAEPDAMKWLNRDPPEARRAYLERHIDSPEDGARDQHTTPQGHAEMISSRVTSGPASTSEATQTEQREPLIELSDITIRYGSKIALGHGGGLNLTIYRGTRLALLGPNGSGKTTLLSLLTSDHPHSYCLEIKYFGRTRFAQPGQTALSLWAIQTRIGHSSPEVHAFFPKHLTVRATLESAWAETYSSKPTLDPRRSAMVDHFLRIWREELRDRDYRPHAQSKESDIAWAHDRKSHPRFGRLHFGTQRLLLLLRAIIKNPDIVILDEAFSGLPTHTRDKAMLFLQHGTTGLTDPGETHHQNQTSTIFPGLLPRQALIVVSHIKEELPACVEEYLRLPSDEEVTQHNRAVIQARCPQAGIRSTKGWNEVWRL